MNMKMTYERPVMREQMFQASEYVAACKRVPGDRNPFAYFLASLKLDNGTTRQWAFSMTPNYARNDGSGAEQWYFHEYNGTLLDAHKDINFANDEEGINVGWGETAGNGTYFLEWSNSSTSWGGQKYYIYEDMNSSGYDRNGDGKVDTNGKGTGSLQVNGGNGNAGYTIVPFSLSNFTTAISSAINFQPCSK